MNDIYVVLLCLLFWVLGYVVGFYKRNCITRKKIKNNYPELRYLETYLDSRKLICKNNENDISTPIISPVQEFSSPIVTITQKQVVFPNVPENIPKNVRPKKSKSCSSVNITESTDSIQGECEKKFVVDN